MAKIENTGPRARAPFSMDEVDRQHCRLAFDEAVAFLPDPAPLAAWAQRYGEAVRDFIWNPDRRHA